jgi:molybdopterin-guanine dinucleotide biosynthesis protein A
VTTGVVLCGGRSRRMGADKALIEVDGVAMVERVSRALDAGGCTAVMLVGGDGAASAATGRPWVPDRWPGGGPAGGVLTALETVDTDILVAACDLPDLDAASVRAVLRSARLDPAVDVVVATTDRREPMLSWWAAGSRARVDAAWRSGTRALRDVIATGAVREVPVAATALRNVNSPADLAPSTHPVAGQTDVRG